MKDLKAFRKRINRTLDQYSHVTKQLNIEKSNYLEVKHRLANLLEAQSILQKVALLVQQKAHKRIASVVSKCLTSVFDKSIIFKINFERKRGKTEASMFFKINGRLVDPMEASGGGLVDVASFALRLASLSLQQPKPRQVIVMDEAFRFVAATVRHRIKDMLQILAKEMGFQFILVSHFEELETGKVIKLK